MTEMVAAMGKDLARAFWILRRLPLPGEYVALKTSGLASGALAARWIATLADRNTDYAPDRTALPRLPPTRDEITHMDAMLDLWLELADDFDRRITAARALRVSWTKIAELDVKRRSRMQLHRVHRDALHKIVIARLKRSS